MFRLARRPFGQGMPDSVFDTLEPKRRTALHRASRDGNLVSFTPCPPGAGGPGWTRWTRWG